MRLQIHRAQLPLPHRIFDSSQEAPVLLLFAHLKPILDKDNAVVSENSFKWGTHLEKFIVLLGSAKFHDVLDQGSVIPATIEEDHFSCSRQFLHIPLQIKL
jgi:hypothetical protein